MAARINHKYSEDLRKKISAATIINRLTEHFDGKIELSPTQLKAGTELLDRILPKLSNIQTDVNVSGDILVKHMVG